MSRVAELVRRNDPDRFFTGLFAPAEARETLFTLYAFNAELARARDVAREPVVALMRLQWWREVVEGARRAHEVAGPLRSALDRGELQASDLSEMISAREVETEPEIATTGEWLDYLRGTAGALAVAAARLLGDAEPERLKDPGTAYGVAGALRNIPFQAVRQRCLLPVDCLAQHGLAPADVVADPKGPTLAAVTRDLAEVGQQLLRQPPKLPRQSLAAGLPAVLARRDLARLPAPAERGTADRIAVLAAWLTGRL